MNVFFDNCCSPALASTLNGYISHSGHRACHIADLPCGRHAADEEWIAMLAEDDGHWIVITGDYRIYRNKAQRAAFRASGLSGFVLAPAYQKTPIYQQASILLWRWPDMEKLMGWRAGCTNCGSAAPAGSSHFRCKL
ncbi:hypothetical protein [Chelatococcus composti]|uniref:VapC45 PIN like domain-containing protein n=1 Tax=Chelatococcus composti TaxID=1743235 RepID=A0A841KKL3_9HYPH|nr:hypothetical protein [Chelatococcus composti]MBB6169913.1 hypothetical protein [Chelatococcus composti]